MTLDRFTASAGQLSAEQCRELTSVLDTLGPDITVESDDLGAMRRRASAIRCGAAVLAARRGDPEFLDEFLPSLFDAGPATVLWLLGELSIIDDSFRGIGEVETADTVVGLSKAISEHQMDVTG